MTDFLKAEREIWLSETPELANLLSAIPQREGKLEIFYCKIAGGLIVVMALLEAVQADSIVRWHKTTYLREPPSDFIRRLNIAVIKVDQLAHRKATIVAERPGKQKASNIIPFRLRP